MHLSECSDASIHSDGFSHFRLVIFVLFFSYITTSTWLYNVVQGFCSVQWSGNVVLQWCDLLCYQEKTKYPSCLRWGLLSCYISTSSQVHSLYSPERCCRFCLWVAHKQSTVIVIILKRGNIFHLYQFSLVYSCFRCKLIWVVSLCVRVWKVCRSGRQRLSSLYLVASTICWRPRGAVQKTTTWLKVAKVKLRHIWTSLDL